ncbi:MAG: hypothetical protein H6R00_70 [Proteobacteria bacterium]|nr:hypothetical protein [Pseudomonadota bacterium]
MTSPVLAGTLVRRDGVACAPIRYEGRWLPAGDVGAVIYLHHAVRDMVAPELLCRETDAFFVEHCGSCGRILGLFVEERLIAYGVLGLPEPHQESFADGFDLSAIERAGVATIDGASVAPEWRGNGLQRVLIAARLAGARAAGRKIAVSTVAPGNVPSLRNLLCSDMTVRALRHAFGGLRFLVRCDLDLSSQQPPEAGRWIALDDVDGALSALGAGAIGWTLSDTADGARIWYAKPDGHLAAESVG